MKTKPILFSTPMIQAILQGKKNQTRRVIKPTPYIDKIGHICQDKINFGMNLDGTPNFKNFISCKAKYQTGDILWVRETFQTWALGWIFKATYGQKLPEDINWKPSIFMPKEACRIFLKVTKVRIERLQDITESDAIFEGVELFNKYAGYICYECGKKGHIGGADICNDGFFEYAIDSYKSLWKSINGKDSWKQNPYVFVYDFEICEKPIDFFN